MTLWKISGVCPHCGGLTFLETMDEARYRLFEPGLRDILHTLICVHCGEKFGTTGPRIQRSEAC